jgi:hypothetical protein
VLSFQGWTRHEDQALGIAAPLVSFCFFKIHQNHGGIHALRPSGRFHTPPSPSRFSAVAQKPFNSRIGHLWQELFHIIQCGEKRRKSTATRLILRQKMLE